MDNNPHILKESGWQRSIKTQASVRVEGFTIAAVPDDLMMLIVERGDFKRRQRADHLTPHVNIQCRQARLCSLGGILMQQRQDVLLSFTHDYLTSAVKPNMVARSHRGCQIRRMVL